jgi:hypothetical protein
MIAPVAKFIDWHFLQGAAMLPSFLKCARGNSKLTEAVEFLNGPNFIPAESKPAELEFSSNIHFYFPSPRPCEFAENNLVYGRLYRRAKDWQKFPTIILLHGGGDFLNHRYRFPLVVPAIHRAGFNVATGETVWDQGSDWTYSKKVIKGAEKVQRGSRNLPNLLRTSTRKARAHH